MKISETDLILNPDGSVYHLHLHPEDVAETIITVGDQERVSEVSRFFDKIEVKKRKREFVTHTGWIGKKRITVISTGIGTDNIDIVFNELDALVNIDFHTRTEKSVKTSLDIIRIGTSGSLQNDIPIDSILFTTYGIGFDTLMNFYAYTNTSAESVIKEDLTKNITQLNPYVFASSSELENQFSEGMIKGMTVTCSGFYGPQGRQVRAKNSNLHFIDQLNKFRSGEQRITNLEMETAGILGMAHMFGHKACSINAILASRLEQKFSSNPNKVVEKAIKMIIEKL